MPAATARRWRRWPADPRMRLILHLGAHKTGTTSIQRILHANRAWYRERGVFVPGPDAALKNHNAPHHAFAHGLTGVDPAAKAASVAYAARALAKAAAAGAGCVVLSSEPVFRHIWGTTEFAELRTGDYWERREAYLRRLKRALDGFETFPVLVLRRQDEFAESLHLSQREAGRGVADFRDFLSILAGTMAEYRRQIALLRDVFGRVRVRSYHRLAASGRLVPAFLEGEGLPVPEPAATVWAYRTPDPRLLIWMEAMRREAGAKPLRAFVASPAARAAIAGPRGRMWRDTAERDAFLARFAGENAQTEREHPDADGQPFFPAPPPVAGSACVLTDEDRQRLAAAFRCWRQDVEAGATGSP